MKKAFRFTELDPVSQFQLPRVKHNRGCNENIPLVFFHTGSAGIVQKYDTRWTNINKFDRLLGSRNIHKQLSVVADRSTAVTISRYTSSTYQESYLVAFEPKKEHALGRKVFNKHFPCKLTDVTIQYCGGVYKFYYCAICNGKLMGFILYVAEKRLIEEQITIRDNGDLSLMSLFN